MTASRTVLPGRMRSAVPHHLVVEPLQLLPAPGVRLLEVHRGAEEVAAAQGVLVTADRLALAAERSELVTDEPTELGERRAGGVRTAGQVVGQRAVGVQATHQLVEQVGATVLGRPPADLGRDLAELSPGGDLAPLGGVAQRLLVPLQRRGHGGQPLGDVALRLLALGRHQVEDAADVLQRPGGHRHLAGRDAGLGHLDLEAEPLDEGVLGQLLALVDRARRLARRPALAGRGRPARRTPRVRGPAAGGRARRCRRRPPWPGRGQRRPRRTGRRSRRPSRGAVMRPP